MNKENDKEFVPRLRFPKFLDDGSWEETTLGDLLSYQSSTISLNKLRFVEAGYPVYGADGIVGMIETYEQSKPYIAILKDGSGVGRITLNSNKSSVLGTLGYLKPRVKFNKAATWLFWLLQTIKLTNYIKGSGIPHLYYSDYKLQKIHVPKQIKEQQKIADCLSSLDELIEAEREKLAALKDHKKGLMQRLFPLVGESAPRLRFEEFLEDGAWEAKPFEEIYNFKSTFSLTRDMLNFEAGIVKNIHYGDIHTRYSALFNIHKERVPFINSNIDVSKIKKENYCLEGDLIFADASEDLNDIGKSIELVQLNGEKLLSGLHTILARQNGKKLIIGFAGYLFQTELVRNQIKYFAQGTKVLGISNGRLSKIIIRYPSNKLEQQKVITCLFVLDDLIFAAMQMIEHLKAHKKGLIQGLFPSIEQK